MPAKRSILLPRLAVAATALSSSSRCSGCGGAAAAAYGNVFVTSFEFVASGRRRAPTSYVPTCTTKYNSWHRPSYHTDHRPLVKNMTTRNMSSNVSSDAQPIPPTTWTDLLTRDGQQQQPWSIYTHNLFPPLTSSSHKGSHGRIAILGGSEKYTGAPFYAAQSALRCGVDLVSVYCASEACIPIKCYSPELMVQGVYSIEKLDVLMKEGEEIVFELEKCKQQHSTANNNEMTEWELEQTMKKLEYSDDLVQNELRRKSDRIEMLSERLAKVQSLEEKLSIWKVKENTHITDIVNTITSNFVSLHTLCIGPGLGRHPLVFSIMEQVIYKAIERKLTLVLDADVLYMLSLSEYRAVLEGLTNYERCVITPNLMEMRRLDEAFLALGIENMKNIIVQKGYVDTLSCATQTTMKCKEEGGLKRSGGIGDVLAGAISAVMAWNVIIEETNCGVPVDAAVDDLNMNDEQRQQMQRLFACWTAATLVKKATKLAYDKKKRSMSAINVIDEISHVLNSMEDALQEK
jgi:NAD(P)H-hydrate repair Nnr-like enzyme with NAD(P)H-hydrate dehydratase domain